VSTPSDPGSGQPDPWAVPPTDPSGAGSSTPPPAYPPAPPPAYPSAPPPPPPGYGQAPPEYGQPQPGYGQAPYGGPQPGYGQAPPPGYAQPGTPGYGYQPMAPTYSYAGWGKRVGASLLDFFAPWVVAFILLRVSIALGVIVYLAAVVWTFYNIYQGGQKGSRWGQKIVGIRMLKETTGQPVGGWLAIGRAFVHILDSIPCYLGYLWPLWDSKKQTFADKIMGTVVVNA
jgi:uncharacterized RDD family membrane protein YckC